jgi:hypothetical protein
MPESGIASSYNRSVFSFLRNLHLLFIVTALIYIPNNSL